MVSSSASLHDGTPDKDAEALMLARTHRDTDASITAVYRIIAPDRERLAEEPIKLLEVSTSTPATGIMPIGFGPHPPSGLHFPTIIVEVHPSEFSLIESGSLKLPNGWKVDSTPLS